MTTDPELDDDVDYNQETRYPHPLPHNGDKVFVKSVDQNRIDLEKDFSGSSTYLDAYAWGAAFDAFGAMVDEISIHDPKAEAGRYPQRKVGRKQVQLVDSFSGIRPIDLDVMRTSCVKMLNFITWIWSRKEDAEWSERLETESRPHRDEE